MELNHFVHPSAIVDQGAEIGAGTHIWHFSHVMHSAKIGEQCVLGQNVFIDRNVEVGKGVKIQNNVSVFDGVFIEDFVFIGPSVVFTNVINPRSFIVRKHEFKKTLIRKGASIGANATIVCGVEIGSYAMIGAGTVVTKDVPPYGLIVGNPGKLIGWVDQSGNRLHFNDSGESYSSGEGVLYFLSNDRVSIKP
ncbi:MAG: acyltransferase [Chitinophagaceae bacterium]